MTGSRVRVPGEASIEPCCQTPRAAASQNRRDSDFGGAAWPHRHRPWPGVKPGAAARSRCAPRGPRAVLAAPAKPRPRDRDRASGRLFEQADTGTGGGAVAGEAQRGRLWRGAERAELENPG